MDSLLSGLALSMLLRSVSAVAGTISLPIEVQKSPQLTHRATGVKDVTLVNNQSDMSDRYYGIKIDVGTPYQELSLALNTRSSDTWFPNFNPVKSSTFVNGSFGSIEVAYGDPTTIPSSVQKFHLDYFEDVFRIAGVRISKQRFGIPSKGPDGLPTGGLLSIGPNLQFGYGRNKPFNTIVDSLAAQGAIASRTYSVDLRGFDEKKGVLLFGGADTGRFSGELVRRPLLKDELGTWAPSIALTGMGQTSSNGSVQAYGVNAADSIFTLDTANQYMRLRHSFVDPLLRDLGAINDGNDLYTAPCSKRDGPGSWDFHFGNATIKIPYKNLILDATVEENSDYCLVAILVTWKGQLVLGGK
ncbi:secreted aspartic proteinase [Colletotrichum higginsianum]|uniref:Secreted aspartic proteinase n=2 Tax=Colletotrichum higginsianum TaxID=80884 RepID=H1VHS2_COLHI|nr:Secreted aspartic proteinase [Colletotrichum higginsianum IMI 349063]OBR13348.1 Secreted aspartic proteinase [Colletotrichum higginsianum IMI 349063]CCF39775.1 secreted aspartic proteinase [Colletotrichum higginsianum]